MIKQLFFNLSQLGKGDWWIEILTNRPFCIYYFGPFASFQEADTMRPGYVSDLMAEGVYTMQVLVKPCHPARLTIFDEAEAAEFEPIA